MSETPCFVCGFMHPDSWECPEQRSEVALRLAIDRITTILKKGKITERERDMWVWRRNWLGGKLRGVKRVGK